MFWVSLGAALEIESSLLSPSRTGVKIQICLIIKMINTKTSF